MVAGSVLVYMSNAVTDSIWVVPVAACGFVALLRPYSDGPEPGGWVHVTEQKKKAKEEAKKNKLKSRRERCATTRGAFYLQKI
jgi:hypothetical protein